MMQGFVKRALAMLVLRVSTAYQTYVYLCLDFYSIASFVWWTSMCLMYNTLNTMQHTASGEWYLVGNSLQHTATRKLHKEAPSRPQTATHCNYCDTLQHTATHSSKLQQVSLSTTRKHIVGATLRHTTTYYNTPQHNAAHCNALQ